MAIQRPAKRQRLSGSISPVPPLTPDDSLEEECSGDDSISSTSSGTTSPRTEADTTSQLLERATNVLRVEADALQHVSRLYETDDTARSGLLGAVAAIVDANRAGGKLIVCGVGKSAYIAQKLTATLKSFSVRAAFMHACEAAHGDLGDLRPPHDLLLFVTFSGKTPELMNLLPHLPQETCVMALTAHRDPDLCPLLAGRSRRVLLPAPVLEPEDVSFGVCAPTTSTTVALAVADMLALTVAGELHRGRTQAVFTRNHPGGAIGITHREKEVLAKAAVAVAEEEDMITVVEIPSPSVSAVAVDC